MFSQYWTIYSPMKKWIKLPSSVISSSRDRMNRWLVLVKERISIILNLNISPIFTRNCRASTISLTKSVNNENQRPCIKGCIFVVLPQNKELPLFLNTFYLRLMNIFIIMNIEKLEVSPRIVFLEGLSLKGRLTLTNANNKFAFSFSIAEMIDIEKFG